MGGFIRTAPWVTLAGAFIMLSGLSRDARMHAVDPTLASREGVFTMANPAHALFAIGIALVVAGTLMFLIGLAARRGRLFTRVLSGATAGLLVLMSLNLFAVAARGGGHDGHSHMHGAAAGAPHSHGSGPSQSTATPEQQAAAAKLLRDVQASLARYANLSAAQAVGYRQVTPYRFLRWGPAHYHNMAMNRDDGLLDPARPEALVYMKLRNGEHVLLGAMFVAPKGMGPRPGGPITAWHVHENFCIRSDGRVALPRGPGKCPEGAFFVGDAVEMIHIWTFDHPGGPFAHELTRDAIQAALKQFGQ